MLMRLPVEAILFVALVMWLFNLLSYIPVRVKDVVNSVVIVLLLLRAFGII